MHRGTILVQDGGKLLDVAGLAEVFGGLLTRARGAGRGAGVATGCRRKDLLGLDVGQRRRLALVQSRRPAGDMPLGDSREEDSAGTERGLSVLGQLGTPAHSVAGRELVENMRRCSSSTRAGPLRVRRTQAAGLDRAALSAGELVHLPRRRGRRIRVGRSRKTSHAFRSTARARRVFGACSGVV
ncbi:hypothetical protein AB0L71_09550 [Streptomyces sp. NPDC052052]|uniref:hypothetical protein n=1 Tax=Streptomyces sp. NPDC052052 TaxID=3154756 RepID=UPI0034475290